MNFAAAVKALIVDKDKILLIKRKISDAHCPGEWELPGGRLEPGEDPIEGLKREIKEETGLEIEVVTSLGIKYFQRDDGQKIFLINFLCRSLKIEFKLGNEHDEIEWIEIEEAKKKIHPAFLEAIERFEKL
ncbi:NUDIX domain-containing protein [Candidatus Micrarchaeota archaeon]|jgi:8-oxo-dGTP diphosphatase|nr:NUDIX domain-containing protein [Candidatus Micrarchaeota archaeon]